MLDFLGIKIMIQPPFTPERGMLLTEDIRDLNLADNIEREIQIICEEATFAGG